MIDTTKCLVCNSGGKNDVLHWHIDPDSGNIWCWCCKENRGYSIREYCFKAGISLPQFLKSEFDFRESAPNEIRRMEWPQNFVPLSDPRALPGVKYLKKRGLSANGDMYYDMSDKGIVFPYYFDSVFCGAQVRFIENKKTKDGEDWKITTMPGTRLGLVIYAYNQKHIMAHVKAIVVTEGALNALSIQQSLDKFYGGMLKNSFKVVACSGSGGTAHQLETFKELIDQGYKVICAPDNDEAGKGMLEKYVKADALTHWATTDSDADWNDELVKLGNKNFAQYFIKRIEQI